MTLVLKRTLTASAAAAILCAGSAWAQALGPAWGSGGAPIVHETNPAEMGLAPTAGGTGAQTPDITYHGGTVMKTPTTYLIWYGNWNQTNNSDTPAGQQVVRDFLHGVSGSPYYQSNASFGTPSGLVTGGKETTVTGYPQGTGLTDASISTIVGNAIGSGALPTDTNGVYFVLTSTDVNERSGFCTQYCGWHTYGTLRVGNTLTYIKYAFVGNANRCLSACAAQATSPNNNAGVDGMISVIAHELSEANTDPLLNAWYDSKGAESSDKCAWTFGSHLSTAGAAFYNVSLPGVGGFTRNYLVQRLLDVNSKCYVNYVTKAQ